MVCQGMIGKLWSAIAVVAQPSRPNRHPNFTWLRWSAHPIGTSVDAAICE